MVKVHSVVIVILSISCFELFLLTAVGSHVGMPNYQIMEMASCKKQSDPKLVRFY